MKKLENIKTTTYEAGKFLVNIVETEKLYEAYIQMKGYGVKDLMFGMPKEQQSLDEFLEIVEANLPEYACDYIEEYADTSDPYTLLTEN